MKKPVTTSARAGRPSLLPDKWRADRNKSPREYVINVSEPRPTSAPAMRAIRAIFG